jgi:hypothetical protein
MDTYTLTNSSLSPGGLLRMNTIQATRLQADAWDSLIEHWLAFERQRVNRGYAGYDDWHDEEWSAQHH